MASYMGIIGTMAIGIFLLAQIMQVDSAPRSTGKPLSTRTDAKPRKQTDAEDDSDTSEQPMQGEYNSDTDNDDSNAGGLPEKRGPSKQTHPMQEDQLDNGQATMQDDNEGSSEDVGIKPSGKLPKEHRKGTKMQPSNSDHSDDDEGESQGLSSGRKESQAGRGQAKKEPKGHGAKSDSAPKSPVMHKLSYSSAARPSSTTLDDTSLPSQKGKKTHPPVSTHAGKKTQPPVPTHAGKKTVKSGKSPNTAGSDSIDEK